MSAQQNKALFLDRDGVINIDRGHVGSRESFEFQEGIFDLCRRAQDLGYLLVVVTNQAGIARGYYTESQFQALTDWMIGKFAEERVSITRQYYCPYHPVHGVGQYKRESVDRKPAPGMLLRARKDLNLDLTASLLIGDHLTDIQAARAAGIGTLVLLRSTDEEVHPHDSLCICDSLQEICDRFFTTVPEVSPSRV